MIGILFSLAVIGLTALSLWHERGEALRHSASETGNLSETLAEQTAQMLETIDLSLRAGLTQLQDVQGLASENEQRARVLRAHGDVLASVTAIGIYGPRGEQRVGSSTDDDALPRSLAGTDTLAVHRMGKSAGLDVSPPVRVGTDRKWHLMLSRRIDGPTGEFYGLIVAMLDARHLCETYKAIKVSTSSYVTLFGWNQILLATCPWRDDVIGKSFEIKTRNSDGGAQAPDAAELRPSLLRPGRALTMSAPIRGYPLTLSLSMDETAALAYWRRHAYASGSAAVVISILALTLALVLDRHLRRREELFKRLRENQAELTEAQRIARLGNFSIDTATGNVRWSPQAASLLGIPMTQQSRCDEFLEKVHEDDRVTVKQACSALRATGRLDVEFRVVPAAREIRWFRARAERVADDIHGEAWARGTLADVSDERRAQEAIQHLAAVVESTEDAIFSVTADMRVLSWNRGASRMIGYSAAEIIGRRLEDFMPAAEVREAARLIGRTSAGEVIEGVETALTGRGGKRIRIAVTLSPLRDSSGRITATSGVARDITARHEAERRRSMEHRIAELLAESAPVSDTMPRILEVLCRALAMDHGTQWDIEADSARGRPVTSWAHPARGGATLATTERVSTLLQSPSPELTGAWRDAAPRWHHVTAPPSAAEPGVSLSVLLMPITLGARTITLLQLIGREPTLDSPELMACARAIGSQIGQYIERRRAEDALRAEKEYIGHVIASAPTLIACVAPDGTTRSVNPAVREITQYNPADIEGRDFWETLHAGGANAQVERLLEAARAGGIADYPLTVRTVTGELRDLSVSAAARTAPDGSLVEYVLIGADITSRRLDEARRAAEYAVARALSEETSEADAIPRILRTVCAVLGWDCGVYRVFDAETRAVSCLYSWCNGTPALYDFIGELASPRELPASNVYWRAIESRYPQWDDNLPERAIPAFAALVAQTGLCAVVSIPVQAGEHPLGALQFFSRSNHRPENALIEAMQVIGHQVGQFIERKRVEAARHQADERLRGIAANVPGIVFEYRLNADGSARFEFVSERSLDVLEESSEDLMNDPRIMFDLVDPAYRRQLLRSMHVSRRNRALWLSEMPIRTRSGRVKWVRGQSMPKHLDDGSVIWDGVIVDVTAQKQAEHAIQHMNEQLERRVADRTAQLSAANRELESFAYSVSHDLRAPLRSIDGFSRILMEEYAGKFDATATDYLTRVRNASQRMAQLIDDLLALSRVTRSDLKLVRTDLSAIATAIIEELRAESPERKVDVSIHPGMTCLADPNLIRIALYNLLDNAWKFTSKRARASIEFGVLSQRDKTVYYVRDDGAGFDMRHAGKLFGAFQRLHSPREFEGTGVGLATVSRIMDRHGGSLWAESALDHGATFYFTLATNTGRR